MQLRNDKVIPRKEGLPISSPMVTTYTQHAHLLSILSFYEKAHPWIFSNYIQLYINKDYIHRWGDFYFPFPYELRPSDTCKWIHTQKIKKERINHTQGSLAEFVIENIRAKNYVHTMVNSFYLPCHFFYQKRKINHDALIHGFDREREVFYISDFFRNRKYSTAEVSFHDFIRAFEDDDVINRRSDYLNGMVYLYEFQEECDYQFDVDNISYSVRAYLANKIPEYWDLFNRENYGNVVFGREIYSTLKNYLLRTTPDKDSYLDIRPFYLLYDHKKIMSLRLDFLYNRGYFKEKIQCCGVFSEVEKEAKRVVNLLVKYSMTLQDHLIEKVVGGLDVIEEKEYRILADIFFCLI